MNDTYQDRFPVDILRMLDMNDAPERLKNHLVLVHHTAMLVTDRLKHHFPQLVLSEDEISFGAATHDIGKIVVRDELYRKGKEHEPAGFGFLLQNGISEDQARFTKTHGNWTDDHLMAEDLIVSLADNIWKGKRINELEELLAGKISEALHSDYWMVYLKLDALISQVIIGSDDRLSRQYK